ncbi:MAG: carbohydrate ABC transporter permease [Candidatus Hydrogenedentota bacterium]
MMRRALIYAVLTAGALVTTFPFIWMVSTALKSEAEALTAGLDIFPERLMWSNFVVMFREAPEFGTYFYNSFFVAFSVTAAVVATSTLAGYTFARLEFPGRQLLFSLVLATMMVPFEVTLIPNVMLINTFGWRDTYAALIVPWCANAFSIFLLRQAFMRLPSEFFDAAKVDGCGHLRFLVWIAAPLVKPAAVTVGLLAFLASYNSLMWPLVVTDSPSMRVVQVGLTLFSSDRGVRLHLLMCAATVVILPTLALYFAAQRYFLESAMSAGIKG